MIGDLIKLMDEKYVKEKHEFFYSDNELFIFFIIFKNKKKAWNTCFNK